MLGLTIASNDPSSSVVCVVCTRHFPRGLLGGVGGARYSPPSYAQHLAPGVSRGQWGLGQFPEICFGQFFLFLAVLLN
jgi:hypothetical protein